MIRVKLTLLTQETLLHRKKFDLRLPFILLSINVTYSLCKLITGFNKLVIKEHKFIVQLFVWLATSKLSLKKLIFHSFRLFLWPVIKFFSCMDLLLDVMINYEVSSVTDGGWSRYCPRQDYCVSQLIPCCS